MPIIQIKWEKKTTFSWEGTKLKKFSIWFLLHVDFIITCYCWYTCKKITLCYFRAKLIIKKNSQNAVRRCKWVTRTFLFIFERSIRVRCHVVGPNPLPRNNFNFFFWYRFHLTATYGISSVLYFVFPTLKTVSQLNICWWKSRN